MSAPLPDKAITLSDPASLSAVTLESLTEIEVYLIAHLREIASQRKQCLLTVSVKPDGSVFIYESRPIKKISPLA